MEACIYVSSRAPPRYLRGISLVKNGMLGKSLPPCFPWNPKYPGTIVVIKWCVVLLPLQGYEESHTHRHIVEVHTLKMGLLSGVAGGTNLT